MHRGGVAFSLRYLTVMRDKRQPGLLFQLVCRLAAKAESGWQFLSESDRHPHAACRGRRLSTLSTWRTSTPADDLLLFSLLASPSLCWCSVPCPVTAMRGAPGWGLGGRTSNTPDEMAFPHRDHFWSRRVVLSSQKELSMMAFPLSRPPRQVEPWCRRRLWCCSDCISLKTG